MKNLKNLVCGLGLLAFVVSPAVLADEHPGEHPGTEAGAAAPTTGTEPGGVTETRGAKKTGKVAKTKRTKKTKTTTDEQTLAPGSEAPTPSGN